MRRAGVLGDGPAGWLAAGILAGTGAEVRLFGRGTRPAQAGQVHVLPPELTALALALDPALGARIVRAARPCLWLAEERSARQPRLTRRALTAGLIAWARARGVHRVRSGAVPEAADGGWRWPDGWAADLAVDATGGARALARARGGAGEAVALEVVGAPGHAVGCAVAAEVGPARLARVRLAGGGLGHLAVDARGARLSLLAPAPLHGAALDAAAAPLLALAGARRTDAPLRRIVCPPARLLRLPAHPAAPWFAFGDAAAQTPPVAGYGLTATLRQGRALAAALATGSDPAAAVAAEAEAIWLAAVLSP